MVFAAAANASVTVGQLPAADGPCTVQLTVLQTSVASGTSYTVPSDGVITSWSVNNGDDTMTDLALRVGRRLTGNQYSIVGESPAGAQTKNSVSTYPAQISVKAGDVIGLYTTGGTCAATSGSPADSVVVALSNVTAGSTGTFTSGQGLVPISAKVEPDVDGDGLGDESQDSCVCPVAPVTPTTPAAPAPPAARRGPAPTITAKIAKRLKLSRRGSLSFLVTDSESTSGRATGTISLPKHAKVVRFKTAKFKVGPGKLTKVTLKLSARSLKSVRRALKHHKLKANITLTLGQTVKKLHTALKS